MKAAAGIPALLGVAMAAAGVSAQDFAGKEDEFAHVSAVTAFELGCLADAPDISQAFAAFLAVGLQPIQPGVFAQRGGRLAAILGEARDGRSRFCSVGIYDGNRAWLLAELGRLAQEKWTAQALKEIENGFDVDTGVEGFVMRVAVSEPRPGLITLNFQAVSAAGFQ